MSYTRLDDLYSLHNRLVDDYNDPDKPFEQTEEDRLLTYDLIEKIEDGLLVELPCKVGDTVYEISYNYKRITPIIVSDLHTIARWIEDKCFGKYLFTTKEAAKARLKELQEVKK